MKNPKFIFAAVLAVVFCFAGYNLWGYFKEQQAIQLEQDRVAEERRIEKERRRARKEIEAEEAEKRYQQELEDARIEKELKRQERLAAAQKAEEERARKKAEEQQARKEAELQSGLDRARAPVEALEMPRELRAHLRSLSPNYIRNEPQEFIGETVSAEALDRAYAKALIHRGTTVMMVAAGFSPNPAVQKAFLDIGLGINDVNEAGYTPLMFAAAYNSPEIVQTLVDLGADMSMVASEDGLTAFQLAVALNPDPAVTELFLKLGADINAKTGNGVAPIIVAASTNPNLEIAEILANNGADKSAYFENGRTAWTYVDRRLNQGLGSSFRRITDEVHERILNALEP